MLPQGLGRERHHRRRRRQPGDIDAPVPARHRRVWRGTAFGGAKGRTEVPRIVDWYMDSKIEIDPMITHTMALDDINQAFHLIHTGKSIRSVITF